MKNINIIFGFVILLNIGLVSADINMQWLDETPELNGNLIVGEYYETVYEEGFHYSYGYRNDSLFLEIYSSDDTVDNEKDIIDVFLKFQAEGGGEFGDNFEMLFYRDGTAKYKKSGDADYSELEYNFHIKPDCLDHGGIIGWRVEVEIPLEDIEITHECDDKVSYLFRIYDNYAQTVNFDKSVEPFYSTWCWATPMDVSVVLDENNPEEQTYSNDMESNEYYVLAYTIFPSGYPNTQEPVKVESITLESYGSGDDEKYIQTVKVLIGPEPPEVLGEGSFDGDNGKLIIYPENLYIGESRNIVIQYIMSEDVKAIEEDAGKVPATFYVKVNSFEFEGRHTHEDLDYVVYPTGQLLQSNGLLAYDCEGNDGCPDDEFCAFGFCRNFPEGCGYATNHEWNEYECCEDETCAVGNICQNNLCVLAPVNVECTSNNNCDDDEKCLGGECIEITGECGYADDHKWVKYDCCDNGDCIGNEVCINYKCIILGEGAENDGETGDIETTEIETNNDTETTDICISTGCNISNWVSCECKEGETKGIQIGRCADNCGNTIYKNQSCTCDITPIQTIEETDEIKEEESIAQVLAKEGSMYMYLFLLILILIILAYWNDKKQKKIINKLKVKQENEKRKNREKQQTRKSKKLNKNDRKK